MGPQQLLLQLCVPGTGTVRKQPPKDELWSGFSQLLESVIKIAWLSKYSTVCLTLPEVFLGEKKSPFTNSEGRLCVCVCQWEVSRCCSLIRLNVLEHCAGLVLLCNKLLPKHSSLKQQTLSHTVIFLRNPRALGYVILAQSTNEVMAKLSVRAIGLWGLNEGWRIYLQAQSAGCQQASHVCQ